MAVKSPGAEKRSLDCASGWWQEKHAPRTPRLAHPGAQALSGAPRIPVGNPCPAPRLPPSSPAPTLPSRATATATSREHSSAGERSWSCPGRSNSGVMKRCSLLRSPIYRDLSLGGLGKGTRHERVTGPDSCIAFPLGSSVRSDGLRVPRDTVTRGNFSPYSPLPRLPNTMVQQPRPLWKALPSSARS